MNNFWHLAIILCLSYSRLASGIIIAGKEYENDFQSAEGLLKPVEQPSREDGGASGGAPSVTPTSQPPQDPRPSSSEPHSFTPTSEPSPFNSGTLSQASSLSSSSNLYNGDAAALSSPSWSVTMSSSETCTSSSVSGKYQYDEASNSVSNGASASISPSSKAATSSSSNGERFTGSNSASNTGQDRSLTREGSASSARTNGFTTSTSSHFSAEGINTTQHAIIGSSETGFTFTSSSRATITSSLIEANATNFGTTASSPTAGHKSTSAVQPSISGCKRLPGSNTNNTSVQSGQNGVKLPGSESRGARYKKGSANSELIASLFDDLEDKECQQETNSTDSSTLDPSVTANNGLTNSTSNETGLNFGEAQDGQSREAYNLTLAGDSQRGGKNASRLRYPNASNRTSRYNSHMKAPAYKVPQAGGLVAPGFVAAAQPVPEGSGDGGLGPIGGATTEGTEAVNRFVNGSETSPDLPSQNAGSDAIVEQPSTTNPNVLPNANGDPVVVNGGEPVPSGPSDKTPANSLVDNTGAGTEGSGSGNSAGGTGLFGFNPERKPTDFASRYLSGRPTLIQGGDDGGKDNSGASTTGAEAGQQGGPELAPPGQSPSTAQKPKDAVLTGNDGSERPDGDNIMPDAAKFHTGENSLVAPFGIGNNADSGNTRGNAGENAGDHTSGGGGSQSNVQTQGSGSGSPSDSSLAGSGPNTQPESSGPTTANTENGQIQGNAVGSSPAGTGQQTTNTGSAPVGQAPNTSEVASNQDTGQTGEATSNVPGKMDQSSEANSSPPNSGSSVGSAPAPANQGQPDVAGSNKGSNTGNAGNEGGSPAVQGPGSSPPGSNAGNPGNRPAVQGQSSPPANLPKDYTGPVPVGQVSTVPAANTHSGDQGSSAAGSTQESPATNTNSDNVGGSPVGQGQDSPAAGAKSSNPGTSPAEEGKNLPAAGVTPGQAETLPAGQDPNVSSAGSNSVTGDSNPATGTTPGAQGPQQQPAGTQSAPQDMSPQQEAEAANVAAPAADSPPSHLSTLQVHGQPVHKQSNGNLQVGSQIIKPGEKATIDDVPISNENPSAISLDGKSYPVASEKTPLSPSTPSPVMPNFDIPSDGSSFTIPTPPNSKVDRPALQAALPGAKLDVLPDNAGVQVSNYQAPSSSASSGSDSRFQSPNPDKGPEQVKADVAKAFSPAPITPDAIPVPTDGKDFTVPIPAGGAVNLKSLSSALPGASLTPLSDGTGVEVKNYNINSQTPDIEKLPAPTPEAVKTKQKKVEEAVGTAFSRANDVAAPNFEIPDNGEAFTIPISPDSSSLDDNIGASEAKFSAALPGAKITRLPDNTGFKVEDYDIRKQIPSTSNPDSPEITQAISAKKSEIKSQLAPILGPSTSLPTFSIPSTPGEAFSIPVPQGSDVNLTKLSAALPGAHISKSPDGKSVNVEGYDIVEQTKEDQVVGDVQERIKDAFETPPERADDLLVWAPDGEDGNGEVGGNGDGGGKSTATASASASGFVTSATAPAASVTGSADGGDGDSGSVPPGSQTGGGNGDGQGNGAAKILGEGLASRLGIVSFVWIFASLVMGV